MIPPKVKQQVALVVPGVGRLLAKVEKAEKTVVSLTLAATAKSGSISMLSSDDATLVYNTTGGVERLVGTVRRVPLRSGVLRFEVKGRTKVHQQREHVRVEVALAVTLFVRNRTAAPIKTHTVDLSGGGLGVRDPGQLYQGDVVGVSLDLDDGEPRVIMTGKVMRPIARDMKGIQIERISTKERERLIRFIFARQRALLKMARGE